MGTSHARSPRAFVHEPPAPAQARADPCDTWGMRISGAVLAASMLLGCTGGGSSSSGDFSSSGGGTPAGGRTSDPSRPPQPCSPLDGETQPITLAKVLGAGRHADGTIYVLDEGQQGYRAFVSEGAVLQRKKVAGSGAGQDWIVASVSDPNAPFSLNVEHANGAPTRMGVFRGDLKEKTFTIGAEGDVLELVDASAYASLELRNIPAGVFVEYDASTSDGRRLVVTRPDVDWAYDDFRVFFGTRAQMLERPVKNVSRGSSTFITFDVDGVEHDAVFASSMSSHTNATLTVNGEEEGLDVNTTDLGVGLSYFCL